MTFIVDGTNGLTFPDTSVQASAGKVLQVVQTIKSDTFSSSSSSYVDITGLSVSITPKFSTSKILVLYQFQYVSDSSASAALFQLVRNSTAVYIGDAASSRARTTHFGSANIYSVVSTSGSYLDSPATTSSVTYKFQTFNNGGLATYINRTIADRDNPTYDPRAVSSILVMEIAA